MIADGLAAISVPTPPDPKDKNAIKAASDSVAKAAFGKVPALDYQIGLAHEDFNEAYQKFQKQVEKD